MARGARGMSRPAKPSKPVLGPKQKEHVQKLKDMGVEDPRKFFLAGKDEGYTWQSIKGAAKNLDSGGPRVSAITSNPIYAGSGSSSGAGGTYVRPPRDIESGVRVAGAGSPVSPDARDFFSSGGGAGGGGTAGGNPLTAGTAAAALEAQDLDSVLHGAKRKGRVRKLRGTE